MDQTGGIFPDVFWVTYVTWGLMEMWVLSRDRRRFSGRTADRGSFFGFVICIWSALGIAFTAFGRHPEWRIAILQPGVFGVGVVMAWTGMAFRLWSVLTLGALFRTSVVVQDGHQLVTAGPYRWLRHPAYTGSIITMTGLGLAFGNWVSLAAMVLFPGLAIAFRVYVEERALTEQFGAAYEDFRKSRSAVLPMVW